jgi:hypothetical protein
MHTTRCCGALHNTKLDCNQPTCNWWAPACLPALYCSPAVLQLLHLLAAP